MALLPAAQAQQDLRTKLKDLNVRHQTGHYRLAGTVADERMQMYGQALEYIYREYARGFASVLEDQDDGNSGGSKKGKRSRRTKKRTNKRKTPAKTTQDGGELGSMAQADQENRFPVIIFANRQQYLEFGRAFLGSAEHTIGMYVPSCKLLLILDQGNFEDTYEVLFHEAFHQFMDRYIANPPVWLNEGLAVHYGYARPTAGGLSFRQPPPIRWQLTRKLIQKSQALSLWEIINADSRTFYSKVAISVSGFERVTVSSMYYAQAYTLVHTLLSDKSGRERLRDYLRDLARDKTGRKSHQITREYFGPDICEHMTPFWIKHVNSRPETK